MDNDWHFWTRDAPDDELDETRLRRKYVLRSSERSTQRFRRGALKMAVFFSAREDRKLAHPFEVICLTGLLCMAKETMDMCAVHALVYYERQTQDQFVRYPSSLTISDHAADIRWRTEVHWTHQQSFMAYQKRFRSKYERKLSGW